MSGSTPAAQTDPALDIRDLTIRADDGRMLVEGLTLTAGPGQHVALIGESGSGKSLTSLAVMGLLPEGMTATGSIRVAGHEMVGVHEKAQRAVRGRYVGIVFQEPLTALDPLMRLGDQLGEAIVRAHANRPGGMPGEQPSGVPGEQPGGRTRTGRREAARGRLSRAEVQTAVRDALAAVRLHEPDRIARAYPHEASGGQRQRVAIAMALAAHPGLLILDEPTTALDVTVQAEVLQLLRTVAEENAMATLFVSHDLAVVAEMAQTAVVLRRGRAVESGAVADLLTAPHEPYTRRLVGAARALDAALDVGSDAGGRS